MDSGVLILLPVGGYMFAVGKITLSTFLMFLFIGIGLTRFMKQLTNFGSNLTQIFKGVDELREVLNTKEIEDNGTIKTLENYDVEFNHVSFSYGKNRVLEDVNFRLRQGTITALVGPSGAGKTTVARLIPRFWDVTGGEIAIGGHNIKSINGNSLMNHISFVFQDIFMFNDTVIENIRMGDTSISEEKVIEIARQAQVDEFIRKLKDGYYTVIGSIGTHLSGGEQQRIAIARALAKNAPVIVLDEATSYADTENEDKIQKALNALLKDRTVIVIAHRLSTIKNADQILYINQGKIMEGGSHEQLIELNGQYKQMWDLHIDASQWGIQ
jgi:ATP-binding cassette subfamily B protein